MWKSLLNSTSLYLFVAWLNYNSSFILKSLNNVTYVINLLCCQRQVTSPNSSFKHERQVSCRLSVDGWLFKKLSYFWSTLHLAFFCHYSILVFLCQNQSFFYVGKKSNLVFRIVNRQLVVSWLFGLSFFVSKSKFFLCWKKIELSFSNSQPTTNCQLTIRT